MISSDYLISFVLRCNSTSPNQSGNDFSFLMHLLFTRMLQHTHSQWHMTLFIYPQLLHCFLHLQIINYLISYKHPPLCSNIQSIWSWSSKSNESGVSSGFTLSPSTKKRSVVASTPFLLAYVCITFDIFVDFLILKNVSSPVYTSNKWINVRDKRWEDGLMMVRWNTLESGRNMRYLSSSTVAHNICYILTWSRTLMVIGSPPGFWSSAGFWSSLSDMSRESNSGSWK